MQGFSRFALLGLFAASGCANSDPTWALDVMFVVPEAGDVSGSTSWQVYRKAWKRSFNQRHYLCSVLVTFEGTSVAPDCPDCLAAMDLVSEVSDSDCSDALTNDPTFVSVQRIGFGPVAAGGPYPDQSSAGFVDYGLGWEVHGWAYPDALSLGQTVDNASWDGSAPFSMAPSFAWQLGPTDSAAAVSRLAFEDTP